MHFVDEKTGDIDLQQGDSFLLPVEGISTDKNYKVYFSIYDKHGRIIGDEIWVYSNHANTVLFNIPSSLTDLLTVPGGIESTEEYYYGIKECDEETGYENTLCIGDNDIGELNRITVYPKKTEGTR